MSINPPLKNSGSSPTIVPIAGGSGIVNTGSTNAYFAMSGAHGTKIPFSKLEDAMLLIIPAVANDKELSQLPQEEKLRKVLELMSARLQVPATDWTAGTIQYFTEKLNEMTEEYNWGAWSEDDVRDQINYRPPLVVGDPPYTDHSGQPFQYYISGDSTSNQQFEYDGNTGGLINNTGKGVVVNDVCISTPEGTLQQSVASHLLRPQDSFSIRVGSSNSSDVHVSVTGFYA